MSTFIEAFIVLHSASRRGDSGLETVISMKKWNFESQNSTFCLSHSFLAALQEVSEGTLKFQNSYLAPPSKITTMIVVHLPENQSQHKNISGSKVVKSMFCWCLEFPQPRGISRIDLRSRDNDWNTIRNTSSITVERSLYRIAHPTTTLD